MWSDKYQAEIEGTTGRELLQIIDIQLNISLKLETQIEFCEKIILGHGNTFQTRYGRNSKMIRRVRGTSSKLDVIFNFCC